MSAVLKEPQITRPVAQFISKAGKLLIDGKWIPAASEQTFEVKNPATGATIAHAAEGDKADIDAAVRAARRAPLPGVGRVKGQGTSSSRRCSSIPGPI